MSLTFRANVDISSDGYDVQHGEWQIGQIYKRVGASLGPATQWAWALNRVPGGPDELSRTGLTETLDEAKEKLTRSWSAWLAWAKLSEGSQRTETLPEVASVASARSEPVAPALPTQGFVGSVARREMVVVEWSKLAVEKSKTTEIEDFGQIMVDVHTKISETLRIVAQAVGGLTIPTELLEEHKQNLSAARLLRGPFDRRYKAVMVRVHGNILSAVQAYAEGGENADLRQWAQVNLPTLNKFLEMAQRLPGEP